MINKIINLIIGMSAIALIVTILLSLAYYAANKLNED